MFAAHLYFQFGVSKGIEFLDDLHNTARKPVTLPCVPHLHCRLTHPPRFPVTFEKSFNHEIRNLFDPEKRAQRIEFVHKNFMHANWKEPRHSECGLA